MAKYGLNQVTLVGNLGRDPELKYLDQGVALTNLWLACTESYRDRNGNQVDRTEWVSVNLWRGQAEVAAKYCRKGSTVCIEGRLSSRSWETPEGETRRVTEVEGRRLILLDGPPASPDHGMNLPVQETAPAQQQVPPTTARPAPADQVPQQTLPGDDDDLPF